MTHRPNPAVVIAFARVPARQNPNLRPSRSVDPLEDYYRAMTVAFASVKRWNSDWPLQLVTNEAPAAQHGDHLHQLGVEVRLCEFDHRPPEGFSRHFAGSLFMLDAARASADRDTMFIDPDVICLRSFEHIVAEAKGSVAAMPLNYPGSTPIGGLTLDEAADLHGLLGEPVAGELVHYGGECYIIPAAHARAVNERAEVAWRFTLERHRSGLSGFPTEEHILSYALRAVPVHSLLPHVRRIWTAATYRTIHGDESSVSLWHLPSEKSTGFRRLHRLAVDDESWFWTATEQEFLARVGRIMGVTSRAPTRWARDQVATKLATMRSAAHGTKDSGH